MTQIAGGRQKWVVEFITATGRAPLHPPSGLVGPGWGGGDVFGHLDVPWACQTSPGRVEGVPGLAQSVEHATLDSGVMSSSPTLGVSLLKKKRKLKTGSVKFLITYQLLLAGFFLLWQTAAPSSQILRPQTQEASSTVLCLPASCVGSTL